MARRRVATEGMIKAFLTDVMLSQEPLDEQAKIAERLKAAEMLAKISGLFDKKSETGDAAIAKKICEVFGDAD